MLTILKFFENPDKSNTNNIISRTLGKIAFADKCYHGPKPLPGEFWLSDVVMERSKIDGHGGCFLSEPFLKLNYLDLVFLNKLNCTVNYLTKNIIIIDPATVNSLDGKIIPWFLSLEFRQQLLSKTIDAILVNLGGSIWTSSQNINKFSL